MFTVDREFWAGIQEPSVAHILAKGPDVLVVTAGALSDDARARIRGLPNSLTTLACTGDDGEGPNRLGWYTPMASPGTIALQLDNLAGLFWHALEKIASEHAVNDAQLRELAAATVYVTYLHEWLHHLADVSRGRECDRTACLREEALAVAWSWHGLHQQRARFGNVTPALWHAFIELRFDYRHARGYADWWHYRHFHLFAVEVLACFRRNDHTSLASADFAALQNRLLSVLEWQSSLLKYSFVRDGQSTSLDQPLPAARTSEFVVATPAPLLELPSFIACYEHDQSDRGKTSANGLALVPEGDLYLCNNAIGSLENIHEDLKELRGALCLHGNPIEGSVLNLFLIQGLQRVVLHCNGIPQLDEVSRNINQQLADSGSDPCARMLDCQDYLIENGLESYARPSRSART